MPLIQRCLCRPPHYTRSLCNATTLSFFKVPPPLWLQKWGHTKSHGWVMGSKNLFRFTSFEILSVPSPHGLLFHIRRLLYSVHSSKSFSNIQPFPLNTNGFSSISHANIPPPVYMENPTENELDSAQLNILKQKLVELGIDCEICLPEKYKYNHLLCPMCNGGDSKERNLSLFVRKDGGAAVWMCFGAKCGWKGKTKVG